MKAKLIDVGSTQGSVREIPLSGDEFLVGRGEDCDLCLYDPGVSRHHCLIRLRGDEATVTDLGSSNGTFVNGTRLISQLALRTGDELRVGPCQFIVDLGDDPEFRSPEMAAADFKASTATIKDLRRDDPKAFGETPGSPPVP